MDFPVDHQELFEFAIEQRKRVNGEFGFTRDNFLLHTWATSYATSHHLKLSKNPEDFGIYYPPDDEDLVQFPALSQFEYYW